MLPRPLLRTFAATAEAVWPGGEGLPGAAQVDAAGALARTWGELPAQGRLALVAMLAAVDAAAVARCGRRLHRVAPERRGALCDRLEHGHDPVTRSAFLGVKTLVLVLVASDPRVEAALGTAGWPPQLLR